MFAYSLQLNDIQIVRYKEIAGVILAAFFNKETSCKEHTELVQHLKEGNGEASSALIRHHYRSVINHAVTILNLESSGSKIKTLPL